MKKKQKENVWEKHEQAQKNGYYNDPRWKEVNRLRKEKQDTAANGLVMTIREAWGLE